MTKLEREWIERCKDKKGDFIIIVDNDEAYVVDLTKGDCGEYVFRFENYGWRLVLDLFLHLGCNAEEA
jgi:hypothetical protein